MKRGLIFLLIVFSLNLVLAFPELEISDEAPQPYETIVFKIIDFDGVIEKEDIHIFDGRRETYADKEVLKIGENYYFYLIINREGNFTLKIDELSYSSSGQARSISFEEEIILKTNYVDNESSILSIKPGFLDLDKNPEISLWNRGTNDLIFEVLDVEVKLKPGDNEILDFSSEEDLEELIIETYKTFTIPIKNLGEEVTPKPPKVEYSIESDPEKIRIEVFELENFAEEITLTNNGETEITEISLSSGLSFVDLSGEDRLSKDSQLTINLNGSNSVGGVYRDNLTVTYFEGGKEFNLDIPLAIYVYGLNDSDEEITTNSKCYDVGGVFCHESETCDGRMSLEVDGCCIGFCETPQAPENEGGNFIIGIVILIILGVVGYIIWKKYKGFKPKTGGDQIALAAGVKSKEKIPKKKFSLNDLGTKAKKK